MSETFRILSIDGGGIRGILPAAFLASVESETGKRFTDYFDLLVGTSVGGIIALGIGLGIEPVRIRDLFIEKGSVIFPSPPKHFRRVRRLWRPLYNREPLQRALDDVFAETKIGESANRLVIPSTNAQTGDVHIYKTAHHAKFSVDYKCTAVEAALATTAAPTYFEEFESQAGIRLLDGGVWANNPVMVGVVEALGILGKSPEEVRVLSLGCTSELMKERKRELGGGLISWAPRVVDLFMRGQSVTALNQAGLLLGKENIVRVQHEVAPGRYTLDGAKNALELVGVASSLARQWLPKIESVFLDKPTERFVPFRVP